MPYYFVRDDALVASAQPPAGAQRLAQLGSSLLPPVITELHRSLHTWGTLGKRPGLLTADRVWATPEGTLVVYFEDGQAPYPMLHVGMAPDMATWFVLLDKWMETFVVVARARTVWTPNELASAMIFVNPCGCHKPLRRPTAQQLGDASCVRWRLPSPMAPCKATPRPIRHIH